MRTFYIFRLIIDGRASNNKIFMYAESREEADNKVETRLLDMAVHKSSLLRERESVSETPEYSVHAHVEEVAPHDLGPYLPTDRGGIYGVLPPDDCRLLVADLEAAYRRDSIQAVEDWLETAEECEGDLPALPILKRSAMLEDGRRHCKQLALSNR